MPRRSLLLLGGGYAEIPLIQAARSLGFRVITSGNRPNDMGHRHADGYVAADFSDPAAVLRAARAERVDAVVSSCNDFSALSAAFTAERLGLPGHDSFETSLNLHHKDRFRSTAGSLGLPAPLSGVASSTSAALRLVRQIGLPVLVKPVDLTGGKGISLCKTTADIEPAVGKALERSRRDYVMIEQFLEGSGHGFTCFIHRGLVTHAFADDEQYYRNDFLVSGTSTPSSIPPAAFESLTRDVELLAAHMSLVDGLVHVQCILTADGPVVIEVCRRCPGDLYPEFVRLSTGWQYAVDIVRAESGETVTTRGLDTAVAPTARHCIMGNRAGRIADVDIAPATSRRIVGSMMWWTPGYEIDNPLVQKLGIVFLSFESPEEMGAIVPGLNESIRVMYEGEGTGE